MIDLSVRRAARESRKAEGHAPDPSKILVAVLGKIRHLYRVSIYKITERNDLVERILIHDEVIIGQKMPQRG